VKVGLGVQGSGFGIFGFSIPCTPDPEPSYDGCMETITLNDALKLSGMAETGGQAKLLIQSGKVKVNGVVETRRKKQLKEGDVIQVGDEEFTLELADQDS
jgi:ribosome-associated protein